MSSVFNWGGTWLLVASLSGCASSGAGLGGAPPLYQRMSDGDVELADATVQFALDSTPSRQQSRWHNPLSGNEGMVTPLRSFKTEGGIFCRHYSELIRVDSEQERYEDTACRAEDGVWYPL
ncbi:hypothetical protein GCM10011348_34640 [Marinobacterium nitratireducens]|uniref:Surface antigen domain-containing protein n=1 Tax=Marinobacterium nitratireducens TaxID=518897 RepID=A0A918DVS5_9GAMM|nr:RT0821/Lpp0805 family surface protein [Marinobacterium nitratireducens]GGO85636.1 hypothetical protein GCM10011348_34640 [Marinobacterium nitratireducens]